MTWPLHVVFDGWEGALGLAVLVALVVGLARLVRGMRELQSAVDELHDALAALKRSGATWSAPIHLAVDGDQAGEAGQGAGQRLHATRWGG